MAIDEKQARRFQRKIRALRRVIIGGSAWFLFFIVLPDYVMGLAVYHNPRIHATLDGISIFVLCGGTVYTMIQIRTLTRVITPVLLGAGLLIFAQIFRILGTMGFFTKFPPGFWTDLPYHTLMELPNGLGMLLFAGGFFYAIVELLDARHIVELEKDELEREVAERKRAERAVADQQVKTIAASRMSALGAMASGLAHEVNNPLCIISGSSQQLSTLLASKHPDPKHIARLTGVMTRNIARIENIVRGLRRLSRDDASDPFSVAPLAHIVLDTIELCKTRFREHGILLSFPEIPPDLAVECRPTQISQVLLNLLNNAHDAVFEEQERWIRIEVSGTEDTVRVSVADSGAGVPTEVQSRVFDPFFTTKPPGEGIGLGLSISKQIIAAHRGDLLLDLQCPHTRFVMILPKRQPNS